MPCPVALSLTTARLELTKGDRADEDYMSTRSSRQDIYSRAKYTEL